LFLAEKFFEDERRERFVEQGREDGVLKWKVEAC
jgi:hypothetical protein